MTAGPPQNSEKLTPLRSASVQNPRADQGSDPQAGIRSTSPSGPNAARPPRSNSRCQTYKKEETWTEIPRIIASFSGWPPTGPSQSRHYRLSKACSLGTHGKRVADTHRCCRQSCHGRSILEWAQDCADVGQGVQILIIRGVWRGSSPSSGTAWLPGHLEVQLYDAERNSENSCPPRGKENAFTANDREMPVGRFSVPANFPGVRPESKTTSSRIPRTPSGRQEESSGGPGPRY